jgi:hypothetical protein
MSGKQVSDNICGSGMIAAFQQFFRQLRSGETYGSGGCRHGTYPLVEGAVLSGQITGREVLWVYATRSRSGNHIWSISNCSRGEWVYLSRRVTCDVLSLLTCVPEVATGRCSVDRSAVLA